VVSAITPLHSVVAPLGSVVASLVGSVVSLHYFLRVAVPGCSHYRLVAGAAVPPLHCFTDVGFALYRAWHYVPCETQCERG
jgi:hypothetical protein